MANYNRNLQILQWNCQSLRRKIAELQHNATNFDVLLISETWLTPSDNIYLRGFDVVRKDRPDRKGGGVAIFVNNKLKYKRVPSLFDCDGKLELCAIELFLHDAKFLVLSCYKPPDIKISSLSWHRFFNQFRLEDRVLIGGDFNSHHTLWGDIHICDEGSKLVDTYLDSNFGILNDGNPTFRSRQYASYSAIDLTFTSNQSLFDFKWSVGCDPWGSDHFPIVIEFTKTCNSSLNQPY